MTREPWPSDPAAALLATVIRDINRRDDQDYEALLAAFLCLCWPTSSAQNQ